MTTEIEDGPVQSQHQAGSDMQHGSALAASAGINAPVDSDASQPLSIAEAPTPQNEFSKDAVSKAVAPDAASVPAVPSGSAAAPSSVNALSKPKAKASDAEKSAGSFSKINKLLHGFGAARLASTGTATGGTAVTDAQVASMRYSSKADFSGSALHILHRGSNYITYIATAQQTGLKLLLKAYDLGKMTDAEVTAAKKKISMLTTLQHQGIARCRGSWQDEKHLYYVQEYGIRGDLFTEMFSERQRLTERFIACKVLKPLLSALVELHSRQIVHRSILPENLHFDKDLNIKLSHFSSAVNLSSESLSAESELSRPASVVDYLAPEVLQYSRSDSNDHQARPPAPASAALTTTQTPAQSETQTDTDTALQTPSQTAPQSTAAASNAQLFPFGSEYASWVPPFKRQHSYDQKADVWAVGCLLFELLTGKGPFEVGSKELTCALILWGSIQNWPQKLSQPCIAFIQACLTKDPRERPSAEQLLQHEWLVKQVEAEAAGLPEGLEFTSTEQQAAGSSSSTWFSKQLTKLKSSNGRPENRHAAEADQLGRFSLAGSRYNLHVPRMCRPRASDIEMGNSEGGRLPYARMLSS